MKLPWNREEPVPEREKSVPRREIKLNQAMMMLKNYKAESFLARGRRDLITTRISGAIVALSIVNSVRMYYVLWMGDIWS